MSAQLPWSTRHLTPEQEPGLRFTNSQRAHLPRSTAPRIAWRELRAARSRFLFVILAVAVGLGFGHSFRRLLLREARTLMVGRDPDLPALNSQRAHLPRRSRDRKEAVASRPIALRIPWRALVLLGVNQ